MQHRHKLVLEFWDRSRYLSASNSEYRSFAIKLMSMLLENDLKNGDLTLDKGEVDFTWTGAKTFIVTGGNVYIKSNLYNGPTMGVKRPKLGIIVLKDLTADANKQKQQGNVYIAPKVTNIQANVFADGSVFSYNGKSEGVCSDATACKLGEPIFAPSGENSAQKILEKTQLLIEGSLSSLNTVGGSLQDSPILGDGTEASGGTSKEKVARARLYDLNFLRWYGGKVKTDPVTGKEIFKKPGEGPKYTKPDYSPCSGEEDDSALADSDDDKGCDIFPPFEVGTAAEKESYKSAFKDDKLKRKNLAAVYIYFDPPPANLPGFGATGGAGQRQLQR